MKLVKSKNKKSGHKKRKKKLSAEEKFHREWQRVQDLQQSNAELRQHVADFYHQVSKKIGDQERLLGTETIALTERLIGFIPKKTLPEYQRTELIDWVHNNFDSLICNPFIDQQDVLRLTKELLTHLESHEQNEFEKWQKKYGHMDVADIDDSVDEPMHEADGDKAQNSQSENIDMFDDLFAEFENILDENTESEGIFDDFSEEEFTDFSGIDEKQQEESKALSKLLKSTSVSKLFRRVAKVLHPDLEQDQAIKKQKHQWMTELVEARDNKDIIKIIAMYTKHVGEPPLDLFNGDYEKMATLLQYQAKGLQAEKRIIIEENPHQAAIYHRFHRASESRVNTEINKHLKALDKQTDSIRALRTELTSLNKIKPILKEIYYSGYFFEPEDMHL